jgi:hypothetical protein
MPLNVASWVDPQEAATHLNKPYDADGELAEFVLRAEQAIADRVGHVARTVEPVTAHVQGGRSVLRLDDRPVFGDAVVSVTVGGVAVPEADLDSGTAGWYISNPRTGLVRHTTTFPSGWVSVAYRPGWPEPPESLKQAALELVRHMWQTQRGSVGGRPGVRGSEGLDPIMLPGSAHTLPYRVEQLIAPYEQVPVA